ncbi:hypothetical protein [Kitasatospora sp. NPDC092286]|uniref:hypothetical protein n=1 Tax=Kitasatospora sp. NPDC092286 TaxID=3364087 RepID=UPI00382E352A
MTDGGDGTWIGEAQGPTHTGPGDQHNHFHYLIAGADRLVRTGSDPRRMAREQRRWLSQRFVPPPGYGVAAERLEKAGTTVLLSGPPGSGRRTAAVMLLHRLGGDDDRFREVSLTDKRDDMTELASGDRLLFDLSGASEQEYLDAQPLLSAYWDTVERRGARLVVVLPYGHEQLLRPDFRQLMATIERPRGDVVLARHLVHAGIGIPPADLRASVLAELLERSAMRELQRLAALVAQARSGGGAGGDFESWAKQAAEALSDRSKEVAEQVAALGEGRQRALLLTAAMLNGAPADVVFRQADDLLVTLRHPPDERPRLDRTDLTERLNALRVEVDRDGRVRFDSLAYDAAVRSHFWTYYPDLRESFRNWVGETVRGQGLLGPDDRRNLVARFTEQSLRVATLGPLYTLADQWAAETRLMPEAMEVLARGLAHERFGSAFRARIYDWSVTSGLHPNLVRVLARICLDVMAPTHPDQALVRLHHLARGTAESGPPDAREALFELVRRDPRLYAKLLARLWDGLEAGRPDSPDAGLFLELADPSLSWVPAAAMVRGWRGVLAVAPAQRWGPTVERWLSAMRSVAPQERERLMGVLVDAADGWADRLSRLYLVAHDWANAPDRTEGQPSRAEVAARFWQKIDLAQGIEPIGASGARRTEERTP